MKDAIIESLLIMAFWCVVISPFAAAFMVYRHYNPPETWAHYQARCYAAGGLPFITSAGWNCPMLPKQGGAR